MADNLKDTDTLLVFQYIPETGRYKAIRMSWGEFKVFLKDLTIKGDTGPQGNPGIKGDVGPQGIPGPRGLPGKDGTNGVDGLQGIQGIKGDTGLKGDQGIQGTQGPAGTPKRVERYTSTTNASGIASFTFSSVFTSVPDIEVVDSWSGEQMIAGGVLSSSVSGCTVQGMTSRGTLLLTAGPFTKAGAGVSITIKVIGN